MYQTLTNPYIFFEEIPECICCSDGQTDTTTTDQSASPAYSSPGIVSTQTIHIEIEFDGSKYTSAYTGEEGDTDQVLDSADEEFSG